MLSELQIIAAQALVSRLGWQSGHAQDAVVDFPVELLETIKEAVGDLANGPQCIRDAISRHEDRVREQALAQEQAAVDDTVLDPGAGDPVRETDPVGEDATDPAPDAPVEG